MKRGRLWQLEALRGFAALYVLIHHTMISYLGLTHTIWGLPFRFGREAVLIFFLLSGFVIAYSHPNSVARPDTFRNYFIKRLRRIYPIFGLSLLLAYAVWCLSEGSLQPVHWSQLLGNVFMLQNISAQPGVGFPPYAHNSPLWSLSYEWWFYMLFFPINCWVPRSSQKYVALAVALTGMAVNLFYPNCVCWYFVFFLIWWWGVEVAHEFRETGDISFARQKSMLAIYALPIIWYAVVTWRWLPHATQVQLTDYPIFELRYFIMASVIILLVIAWRQIQFAGFDSTLGHFRSLGGISFALYVFHYPIIRWVRFFSSSRLFYVDFVLRVGLVFFLAWLAEGVLQKWINKITDPLLKRDRRAWPAQSA